VTRDLKTLAFVLAFALASTAVVSTQEKEKIPTPAAAPKASTPAPMNVTPLKVQVVIARYQGEKKLSSMPYTLTLNANNHANLRMGARIPIVMLAMTNMPKDAPAGGPIQYQDVGTNIDCNSTVLDDGRYLLLVSVDDTSVYPDEPQSGATKGSPSFRSFRAANSMVLRNGETGQFTTATDKVTGETVKVDVTLTVLK
jgi:type II secretory pathway component GspD/PulD (secretin)